MRKAWRPRPFSERGTRSRVTTCTGARRSVRCSPPSTITSTRCCGLRPSRATWSHCPARLPQTSCEHWRKTACQPEVSCFRTAGSDGERMARPRSRERFRIGELQEHVSVELPPCAPFRVKPLGQPLQQPDAKLVIGARSSGRGRHGRAWFRAPCGPGDGAGPWPDPGGARHHLPARHDEHLGRVPARWLCRVTM